MDGDPLDIDPLDRDHLDRDPPRQSFPWTETPPEQRPLTETPRQRPLEQRPLDRDPLNREPTDRDPLDRDAFKVLAFVLRSLSLGVKRAQRDQILKYRFTLNESRNKGTDDLFVALFTGEIIPLCLTKTQKVEDPMRTQSKFFHFITVFGKIMEVVAPSLEILDPPLKTDLITIKIHELAEVYFLRTRMHSRRMRTALSLTVSRHMPCTPPPPTCMPPHNHACPPTMHVPLAATHASPGNHACPPATMHTPSNHAHPWQPCMPPSNHARPPATTHAPR